MHLKLVLPFLRDLSKNNDKEWFAANKSRYQAAKTEFETFIASMIDSLRRVDPTLGPVAAKDCTFRIFRDVRFSKDPSPYKTNFGAYIAQGGRKSPLAGYYIHVESDKSFVGGGIYMPEPAVLKTIRTAIFEQPETLKLIINQAQFKTHFSTLYGEKLKLAPKGFPKDFPDVDLLQYKHYAVAKNVGDDFWEHPEVVETLTEIFKAQMPFNHFLNGCIADRVG